MNQILKPRIALVGATGAVGQQMLSILESRRFPLVDLIAFASPRSEGRIIAFNGKEYNCNILRRGCFKDVDIAFFDATDAVSTEWVPHAAEAGAWVVDNSASFRLKPSVPLVVPEINGHIVTDSAKNTGKIIAGPNCSTVQLTMALKPLHDVGGLKRVVVSTYQSTSGAGSAAMRELATNTRATLDGRESMEFAFTHQIAFNSIPHIGSFSEDGFTSEEKKLMNETRKILDLPDLKISATAVRIPTFNCHCESVNVELQRKISVEQARDALRSHPGITLEDEPTKHLYPMNINAAGRDAVHVGRIRKDPSIENGLILWIVSDNLRKGAALNAIQIGELIIGKNI
ncbi:MAG: aspartate-semialdehyde dehydrogenase [Bdellovibrionota bacterium]